MKYFLDTEFIETVGHIELISIGIVAEDGREYYAVNTDADLSKASEWVIENVLMKMPEYKKNKSSVQDHFSKFTDNLHSTYWIKERIFEMTAGDPDIQFYGYFADYDWVVFCWIFGTMMDLPKGFPMYCRDLKQMMDERGLTKEWKKEHCPDPVDEHNALADAKWNKKLYDLITNL